MATHIVNCSKDANVQLSVATRFGILGGVFQSGWKVGNKTMAGGVVKVITTKNFRGLI